MTRIKHLNVELPFENKFLQSFEELVKTVTHALSKLNLDWPNDKWLSILRLMTTSWHQAECYLLSGDQFFQDRHTEVLRSWKNPYSASLCSLTSSYFSAVMKFHKHSYWHCQCWKQCSSPHWQTFQEKDKASLPNSLISPQSLCSNACSFVVNRY